MRSCWKCYGNAVYVLSHFSCVQLLATLWTVALQAPPSVGFSRQEHWSGLPRPPPGALPDPGVPLDLRCLLRGQAGSLPLAPQGQVRGNTLVQMLVSSGWRSETPQVECLKTEVHFHIFLTDWIERTLDLSLSNLRERVKDKKVWRAAVQAGAKSQTGLRDGTAASLLAQLHPVWAPEDKPGYIS